MKRRIVTYALLVTLLMFLGIFAAIPMNSANAQSSATISVVSNGGSWLTYGYYIALYDSSGNVVATGFTPASFTATPGQTYSIQAYNYGNCQFSFWAATSGTGGQDIASNPYTFTAALGDSFNAAYVCSGGGPFQLTVSTIDQNGNPIHGYYTVVNQSNTVVATGFSTAKFNLPSNLYTVQVDSYGSCVFSHWAGSGDTGAIEFDLLADDGFTAVMNCGAVSSSLKVNSVNQYGGAVAGYYNVLYDSSSNVLGTGFTPTTYSTTSGHSYSIRADSYGSCSFTGWSNGITSNPMPFTATSSAQSFTAVYSCA